VSKGFAAPLLIFIKANCAPCRSLKVNPRLLIPVEISITCSLRLRANH
jgi:hypothetical protein